MHKPTAVIAAIAAAVALPIAVSSSQAADYPTSPTSTSTTPTTPYTPAPTPSPTPKPTAAPTPVPTAAPPAPGDVLNAFQASIISDLTGTTYTKVLAGTAVLPVATNGAGTYIVSLGFRKPTQKYRSVAKAAVSLKAAATGTTLTLKPNTYAPSTKKFLKKKDKTVRVQVTLTYELNNRTVESDFTTSIKK